MVCADGRKFRFWLFHFAKNGLFLQQKFMSQALHLREFLETYDDEVIILKVTFVPIFYYLLTQPFETKETTIFSLLHTTLIPFRLLNLLYQHRV